MILELFELIDKSLPIFDHQLFIFQRNLFDQLFSIEFKYKKQNNSKLKKIFNDQDQFIVAVVIQSMNMEI
jgi:hypothetical protein